MIGYLKGEILDQSDGKLLILSGTKDSGIGYQVSVPLSAEYDALLIGQTSELFIYTHVREDALDLYGFKTKSEKELFLTLLSVTGIGPRGALGILSKIESHQLIQAILSEDKVFLTSIPGIGKKTAERVVLELADPIRKKMEAGVFGTYGIGSVKKTESGAGAYAANEPAFVRDAKSALLGLGYRENDVSQLLKKVLSESEKPFQKAEDLVRTALRQL